MLLTDRQQERCRENNIKPEYVDGVAYDVTTDEDCDIETVVDCIIDSEISHTVTMQMMKLVH